MKMLEGRFGDPFVVSMAFCKKTESWSFMSIQCNKQFSSMIVPEWLNHKSDLNHEILVNSPLDGQSDSTFVLDKTVEALNCTGFQVNLFLSTMLA